MDVSPGRMTVVTGAGAPFGRKVVRSGVALEVPSSKIQFSAQLRRAALCGPVLLRIVDAYEVYAALGDG